MTSGAASYGVLAVAAALVVLLRRSFARSAAGALGPAAISATGGD